MQNGTGIRVKGIIGAAVVAIAVTASVGTATAGTPKVDAKTTLKEVGSTFRGKVTSDMRTCERKRTVYVYRAQDGDDKLIGIDVTDSNGKYVVDFNLVVINTKHYAVAVPKPTKKANCTESTSKALFPEG